MVRVKAKDIKKVTFSVTIETDDPEFESVKAGLIVEVIDELKLNKQQFMSTVKQTYQSFVDLFEEEVE